MPGSQHHGAPFLIDLHAGQAPAARDGDGEVQEMWIETASSFPDVASGTAEVRARDLMAAHENTVVITVHQPGLGILARCSGSRCVLRPLHALLLLKARALATHKLLCPCPPSVG